jgi:choline-sulfatase
VPLIFAGPKLGTQPRSVDTVTSHIDLLPTLLGLIGADVQQVREQLSASHTEAQPLVGRDLSALVLGNADPATVEAPIYFMADDEPDRGLHERSIPGQPDAATVLEPSHIDAVITRLDGAIWKYTEYRDNTQFWSNPSQPSDVVTHPLGPTPKAPGTYVEPYQVSVKTQPVQTEPRDVELYRLDSDPLELKNLALDPEFAATRSQMANLLAQQRAQKRLVPQTHNT